MSKVIVVYGGGFQPFHAGHLSSYLEAKQAFPNADFYVAASNDTKTRPIPFNDKQFLAQQAGVIDPFVQVKAPINPREILDRYDSNEDIFILVRSERDPVGYTKKDGTPGYYQPYQNLESCLPFSKHGYVFVTKKHTFKLNGQEIYSGTQVRDMYTNSDDQGKINMISQMYPNSKKKKTIKKMMDTYLTNNDQSIVGKPTVGAIKKLKDNPLKENILKIIKDARPLLKEASVEKKIQFMKLIKESMAMEEKELDEISFFKTSSQPKKPEPKVSDYREYFKQEEPHEEEKVYHSWQQYHDEQDKLNTGEVEEARIHQPEYVNLYIASPKDPRVKKKIELDIPLDRLNDYVRAMLDKYPRLSADQITYRAAKSEEFPYGKVIEENPDYLEEK